MIFHFELSKPKRVGGLDQAVYDIVKALNAHTPQTHARVGEYQPDSFRGVQAVHFHGLWSQSHVKIAQLVAAQGIPYTVSPHGMLEPWPLRHKWLRKWVHRKFFTNRYLRGAQRILATSEMEAENIRALFPQQHVQALPLGISDVPELDHQVVRKQLQIPENRFLLLYLSRIDPKKNLHGLLEAILSLNPAQQKRLALAIIGDGPGAYYHQCLSLGKQCSSEGVDLRWLGPIWGEEKWEWLAAADLFTLPSLSENFGYVYLESLASGTPILTTRHTPWGLEGASTACYVCEAEPNSIAQTLNAAMAQPANTELRQTLCTQTIADYHWENLAKRYQPLYPESPTRSMTNAPL